MTINGPRPELFEDLDEYDQRPITLADVTIDHAVLSHDSGLLTAVDNLIAAYRQHYEHQLHVRIDGGTRVIIARERSDYEQQQALDQAQRSWDRDEASRQAAADRDRLAVGDQFDPPTAARGVRCGVTTVDCCLPYAHHGRHIEVADGEITRMAERGA